MRKLIAALAVCVLYPAILSAQSTAQGCTDGTTTYAAGSRIVERRRPSTTPATIATRESQGWALDRAVPIDGQIITTEGGLEYRYLVFACPAPQPPPPPVDCVVSAWSAFSTWTATSATEETRTRTRTVVTESANGGASCPALSETETRAIALPPPPPPPPIVVAPGSNGYFVALLERADVFKAYSLRSQTQIDLYKANKSARSWVTYDAEVDAAKVVIPAFDPDTVMALVDPIDASATTVRLTLPAYPATQQDALLGGLMTTGRALQIGTEVVTVQRTSGVSITGGLVGVLRAQHGTTASAHVAGERALGSVNSLRLVDTVQLPLGTADGHTYLMTWDALYTESLIANRTGLDNYKTFRLEPAWLQVDTRFSGQSGSFSATAGFDKTQHVGVVGMRSANGMGGVADWSLTTGNQAGPGITTPNLAPQIASFILKPNVWVRYWILIEQRANDYDYMTFWAADATRDAVKLFDRVPLSLPKTGSVVNSISKFLVEFNTSESKVLPGRGDFVAYVRNVIALRDPQDVPALLVRPN
jgi:hypothetical protein